MSEPRLVWPVNALLGEGPAWSPEDGSLRFVDIKGGKSISCSRSRAIAKVSQLKECTVSLCLPATEVS